MLNNGWISPPFSIFRGIRQGCPLSSMLFVVAVEILACKIRQDNNIQGFQIKLDEKTHTLKISQLADDTTLFLKSKQDISKSLNLIEIFGTLSGLKLNRSKTEGIWLGRLKHCKEKFEGINWTNGAIKSLGIYFGTNTVECKRLNIEKTLEKSEAIIRAWKKRNLSMIGRITVVKSLILPNITYVATVTTIDKDTVFKFKKMIYNFIWDNKQEKVKRSVLSKAISEGGLRMIDIDKYIEAIQLTWVTRLLSEDHANWKILPTFYFNKFGENFILFKMNLDKANSLSELKDMLPEFYYQIVITWLKYKKDTLTSLNYRKIRQEIIWGNQHIKLSGKSLIFRHWIKDKIIFINDIIDEAGNISEKVILNKLSNKKNWITEVTKLKKSIPSDWIVKLKSQASIKSRVSTSLDIRIISGKHTENFVNFKSKDFYQIINSDCTDYPPGFSKWCNTLKIIEKNRFKNILHFIFHYLKENKLKIFRWKLLHFILPCKQLLFRWHITANDKCNVCNITEDYEHLFVNCQYLTTFWSKIKNLLQKVKMGTHILNFRILMGGYKVDDCCYYDVNYFITIILYVIYKSGFISDQKSKHIDIYSLFKKEFLKRAEAEMCIKVKDSIFLTDIMKCM